MNRPHPRPRTPRSLALAALALLAAGLVARPGLQPASAQETRPGAAVRELVLGERAGTRVEYFRLDVPQAPVASSGAEAPPAGVPAEVPIGLARWTHGPTRLAPSDDRAPGRSGAMGEGAPGWRSDLEVLFHAERLRVLQTERLGDDLRELVFRELGPRGARTVYLAWTPDGTAVSSETVGGVTARREHELTGGALPLSLVDLARRAPLPVQPVRVYRALSNEVETWTPSTEREDARRCVTFRTADGREVGRYWFDGERLEAFRWQAGGPVASAIPADEYERWARAMRAEAPPVEAGAARVPGQGPRTR